MKREFELFKFIVKGPENTGLAGFVGMINVKLNEFGDKVFEDGKPVLNIVGINTKSNQIVRLEITPPNKEKKAKMRAPIRYADLVDHIGDTIEFFLFTGDTRGDQYRSTSYNIYTETEVITRSIDLP